MPNLDHLLHLVSVLGADAAWLLRGSDGATLVYDLGEQHMTLDISEEFGPALLIAHFPDDGSEEYGIQEMRLPPGASDREIQAAALLNVALDQLTRIGPHTTRRVLKWLFERYGITPANYDTLWELRDRRPKADKAGKADPAPAVAPPPATIETMRLETTPAVDVVQEERTHEN